MTTPIISFTPGLDAALARARRLATDRQEAMGVWEHVGLYGQLGGDTPSTHAFKVQPLARPDPPDVWALVACVDPEQTTVDYTRVCHRPECQRFPNRCDHLGTDGDHS